MEFGRNTVSFWCALQVANEEQYFNDNSILQKKTSAWNSQNHDPSKSSLSAYGPVHEDYTERLKHVGRLEGWTEKKGLAELSHQIIQPSPTQVDPILNTVYLQRSLG